MQVSVRVVNVVLPVLRVEDDREGVLEAPAEALADLQDVLLPFLGTWPLPTIIFLPFLFIWNVIQNARKWCTVFTIYLPRSRTARALAGQ